jgi:HNH endonuclease
MARGSAEALHNTSVVPVLLKRCAHCREEKSITEFCRNVQSRDGLTSYCRGCLAIKRAETRKLHPGPKAPDLRQCEVCGKSYSRSAAGGKTKYCSDDCFRRRRERPPVIELRTCVGLDCGKTFEASSHGQTVKQYCSQECYLQTKSRMKALRVVACRWCDQPFTRAERGALEVFCSDVCKKAKRRADKRIAGKRCTARSVRANCDSCGLWFRRQSDSEVTTCQLCLRGEPAKHGLATTYTNRGCRCQDCTAAVSQQRLRNKYKQVAAGVPLDINHRARARRYGVENEYVNKLQVFERDGWICGLCHEPVDREAGWPAAASPSLDHIVPLVLGGPHIYENVQCAHLGCNVIKNDGRKFAKATNGAALDDAARKYHPWTELDIQLVLDGRNLTVRQLAEKLGRSPAAIRKIRSRLGNARGGADAQVQTTNSTAG